MRHTKNIVSAVLCSVMLSLSMIPTAALADVIPNINFPDTHAARQPMPYVDEANLIDDGSFYYDLILSSNESGEAAQSSDYVYQAVDIGDADTPHTDVWVPVRRNEVSGNECTYEETIELFMSCRVDVNNVSELFGAVPSLAFAPIVIQILDENGNIIEDREPMTADEAFDDAGEIGMAERFVSGIIVDNPPQRYTLRITEIHTLESTTTDINFTVDENKGIAVEEDEQSGVLAQAANTSTSDAPKQIFKKQYASGAVFTVDVSADAVAVNHKHSEVLYDPAVQDEEFAKYLAEQYPEGYTAANAEDAWLGLCWSRDWDELNPSDIEVDDEKPLSKFFKNNQVIILVGVGLVGVAVSVLITIAVWRRH